jgi:hypothetical protein
VGAEVAAAALGLAFLGVALALVRQDAEERRTGADRLASPACLSWELPLRIAAGPPEDFAFGPNTIVAAGREARRCGATPALEPRVLLTRPDGGREIVETLPPGVGLLRQCGRVVELRAADQQ